MRLDGIGTVVITGASAGVGRATAVAFARYGCRVGLIARGRDRLAASKAEVEAAGGTGLVLPADMADADAVERAAEAADRELGPIDVWVNNAMVTTFAPFHAVTAEEFQRITAVTYLGQVHGTMAALKRMRRRDRGTIVQVGSALAYRSIPLQSAYCGAKFAVRGFTDALRSELLHDGSAVRLTMVQLPAVNTPQFDWARNKLPERPQPAPPIYQPEVAARAIVDAAVRAPREVWLGRATLTAIAAAMLAPGIADRKLATMGYEGQQSDEPASAQRADNLFDPVPGDFGSHGRFDDRASDMAVRIGSTTARIAVLSSVAAGAAALLLIARRSGRSKD